jgi:hypothetical protein
MITNIANVIPSVHHSYEQLKINIPLDFRSVRGPFTNSQQSAQFCHAQPAVNILHYDRHK